MAFSLDLISDLHIESWADFNWTGQATSLYCIVAGDIAQDRKVLIDTLTHLGQNYAGVFYIDGNDEHRWYLDNLEESYQDLEEQIKKIPNVVYLQNNVVILNDVALLATNGWWSYDFDPAIDQEHCRNWYIDYLDTNSTIPNQIVDLALNDALYMKNNLKILQTYPQVKHIVMVSHTVPASWITEHDLDLLDSCRYNCLGNQYLEAALAEDTEHKVHTWCFGHYHKPVDQYYQGIRYVNNCRGKGNTPWGVSPYYPKKIVID
jgi:hypothetical protein